MEGGSGVTRSITDELHFFDIEGYYMEGESIVTRGIIDEVHSWISKEIKRKVKVVLVEGSLLIFILSISNEIKC